MKQDIHKKYIQKIKDNKILKILSGLPLIFLSTLITLFLISRLLDFLVPQQTQECELITPLLEDNIKLKLTNINNSRLAKCYIFAAKSGDQLIIDTNIKVDLVEPNNQKITFQGNYKKRLLEEGEYSIAIPNIQNNIEYQISLKLIPENIIPEKIVQQPESAVASPLPAKPEIDNYLETKQIAYNPSLGLTIFTQNNKLQEIVDTIVNTAQSRKLPIERLSISLVDLNHLNQRGNCCAYASFQDQYPRYPASVIKLFWLVALFGQYKAKNISTTTISPQQLEQLEKMIVDSDNEAASLILDQITQTKSSKQKLNSPQINQWIAQRYWVNQFFSQSGYQNLNISQKTFPIPNIQLDKPEGPDLQIREIYGQEHSPMRNFVTTNNLARLLSEIDRELAISPSYSQKIKQLLNRDLHPQAWQNKPYNAIKSFLGEELPPNTEFYSKMGWTFSNRNDSAIIASPDQKVRYILVVFGDDPKFYEDKSFFPTISKTVYQKMLDLY